MISNDDNPNIAPPSRLPAAVVTVDDAAKQRRHREWKLANRENIAAYNALVEREGVFSHGLRLF